VGECSFWYRLTRVVGRKTVVVVVVVVVIVVVAALLSMLHYQLQASCATSTLQI